MNILIPVVVAVTCAVLLARGLARESGRIIRLPALTLPVDEYGAELYEFQREMLRMMAWVMRVPNEFWRDGEQ